MTDFTEQFAYRLLRGILRYSRETGQRWEVCRMPPSFKRENSIKQMVRFAEEWKADVVIGQFDPDDNLELFRKKGMVVLAQDYISLFPNVPNITADYHKMGVMAAERFVARGFREFAFFGNNGMCWSDGRRDGFREYLEDAGYGDNLHIYDKERVSNLWYYQQDLLREWLESLPKPVGIFACDDNQAILLEESCKAMGIRIPYDEFCHRLCERFGKPIVSTSANVSGAATAKTFADIDASIVNGVDYAVEYRRDDKTSHQPSNIILLSRDGTFKIIR